MTAHTDATTDDLLPEALLDFLPCATPDRWVEAALDNPALLLIDHAQCEKKAASTAMSLMFRYVDRPELLTKMSQLAREELLHFEQVVGLMEERGIDYSHLQASRYAEGLRRHVSRDEPQRLIDTLIVGAFIEARSCERFARLIPRLDEGLARFYRSLVRSEGRHFEDYIGLAERYGGKAAVAARLAVFAEVERELIESEDVMFRFHSGVPEVADV
ncbi:tRNA-(ms[2]io[6]A)-hydroxylase [Salinicola rhizosphaerae]|uniref:tRNA-(Ms[2]io[6]A)-hydroxylase n=1 Tax=Salinicola rhizosphaerae TaxID=1443141 RepID=A0ABQ3DS35_9GAMM|nr:tRNA-(ms[2]io[6]A)-hydroxylase [Salinicola rhizosphaerae]GHB10480.1 tRNA-(ms[2]io[6]A)-hydroxylase [Salinicola rhizosphaerae]